MDRAFDVITFDCYGTLIDWETGIGEAFARTAGAHGLTLDRAAVLRAYAELEPMVQAERYRSYREVLTETARRVAARMSWKVVQERASFLAESLPDWPPFGDTNPALERLAVEAIASASCPTWTTTCWRGPCAASPSGSTCW